MRKLESSDTLWESNRIVIARSLRFFSLELGCFRGFFVITNSAICSGKEECRFERGSGKRKDMLGDAEKSISCLFMAGKPLSEAISLDIKYMDEPE